MSWLKKIFAEKREDPRLERLVRRLIFFQDEAIFLDALREAVALAPKGDDLGVRALSEAIRRRSGKEGVTFYAPPFGSLTVRDGSELAEAEDRLMKLAESHALLDDPAASQNLISAALSALGRDGLDGLLAGIYALGGTEQGYIFQLLYNQMSSSAKLRHALGEQSWTERMSSNGPPRFG